MRAVDLVRAAVSDTWHASRVRTLLTVLAVVIGSFALTLTSGMGTGVNRYIDETVAAFGDAGALYVQKSQPLLELASDARPRPYDPEAVQVRTGLGLSLIGLSAEDVETIEDIEGVDSVEPVYNVAPTYLASADGTRFQLSLGIPIGAEGIQMVTGRIPAPGHPEIAVPGSWVADLGYSSPDEALGQSVGIVMTNMAGQDRTFEATISGVSRASLAGATTNPIPSTSLTEQLYEHQVSGTPQAVPESYIMARAIVSDPARTAAVQERLAEADMLGLTVEDQLGMFRAVINAVVWILNTSAVIALVAAGLGIVNTLLMSVQERTREIGLMKAMGMSRIAIFGLFSLEAVLIGVLGAALGTAAGIAAGSLLSDVLGQGLLSRLPGLSLFAFHAPEVALIVLAVMAIAFLAGTVPALHAARKDPLSALRHE